MKLPVALKNYDSLRRLSLLCSQKTIKASLFGSTVELENTVGGKERRVGALRQHQKDQAVQLHAVFLELPVARL